MVGGLFSLNDTNWFFEPSPNMTSKADLKKYGDGGFLPFGWEGLRLSYQIFNLIFIN